MNTREVTRQVTYYKARCAGCLALRASWLGNCQRCGQPRLLITTRITTVTDCGCGCGEPADECLHKIIEDEDIDPDWL